MASQVSAATILQTPFIEKTGGKAWLGYSLYCDTGIWDGEVAYKTAQWHRDGSPVPLATDPYYLITEADLDNDSSTSPDSLITCEITAYDAFNQPLTTYETLPVSIYSLAPVSVPTLTEENFTPLNDFRIGEQARCWAGDWPTVGRPLTYTHTILRDGIEVGSNSGSDAHYSYQVEPADMDSKLSCRVEIFASGIELASYTTEEQHVAPVRPLTPPLLREVVFYPFNDFRVGEQAQCHAGDWATVSWGRSYVYEIKRNGIVISTSDVTTEITYPYIVAPADAGKVLSCQVTLLIDSTEVGSYETPGTYVPLVTPSTPPSLTEIGFSPQNDFRIGEQAKCRAGQWTVVPWGLSYTYKLKRNGVVFSTITTSNADYDYTLTAADAGAELSCEVTLLFEGSAIGAHETHKVTIPAVQPIEPPTLTEHVFSPQNDFRIGEQAKCRAGQWTVVPWGLSYTYKLKRNGVVFSTITTSNADYDYTLTAADAGAELSCEVTLLFEGVALGTYETPPVKVPLVAPTTTPSFSENNYGPSNDFRIGEVATCNAGSWSIEGASRSYTYRFKHDGEVVFTIPETASVQQSYTLAPADIGKKLSCEVTVHVQEEEVAVYETPPVTIPAPYPIRLPALTDHNYSPVNDFRVNDTIRCEAVQSNIISPVAYEYRIKRNGETIEATPTPTNITSYDYQLTSADAGSEISCEVTVIASGSAVMVHETRSVKILEPGNNPFIYTGFTKDVIGGGNPLRCVEAPGDYSSVSYQWQRGANQFSMIDIPGAEDREYTTVDDDIGLLVRCVVTENYPEDPSIILISEGEFVFPVTNYAPPWIASEHGTYTHGDKLSCNYGAWLVHYDRYPIWYREGVAISSDPEYIVTSADIGKTIECVITVYNSSGAIMGSASASVDILEPKQLQPGFIIASEGSATHGLMLTCHAGYWAGSGYSTEYRFSRNGTPLNLFSAERTYLITAADIDQEIGCSARLVNGSGDVIATGEELKILVEGPEMVRRPWTMLSQSNNAIGGEIVCNTGMWTGKSYSYRYSWLRDGVLIPGESTPTYIIKAEDSGKEIECRIEVMDSANNIIDSAISLPQAISYPSTYAVPHVARTSSFIDIGSEYVCHPGTWSGAGLGYRYQWILNDVAITGATSNTYTITAADLQGEIPAKLTCRVDAEAPSGEILGSALSQEIIIEDFFLVKSPQIVTVDGHYSHGSSLQCLPVQWSFNPASIRYQWMRNSTVIGTGEDYVLGADDIPETISCVATALDDNENEIASASVEIDTIQPKPLAPVHLFASRGSIQSGAPLVCEENIWLGTGLDFQYEWYRNGSLIEGAIDKEYTLSGVDEGKSVHCRAIAVDGTGKVMSHSDSSATLIELVTPIISGDAALTVEDGHDATYGERLVCAPPTFGMPVTGAVVYEWYRDSLFISGSVGTTYDLDHDDLDKSIMCRVVAVINGNTYTSDSNVIPVSTPVITTPVELTEEGLHEPAAYDQKISCSSGSWTGHDHTESLDYYGDGGVLLGTGSDYVIRPDDVENYSYISCKSTIQGPDKSSSVRQIAQVDSNMLAISAPIATSRPVIDQAVAEELSSCHDPNTWTYHLTNTFVVEWLIDGTVVASDLSYTPMASDEGKSLTCRITPTAGGYSFNNSAITSDPVQIQVLAAPSNIDPPALAGEPTEGQSLACSIGGWNGTMPIDYTVKWYNTTEGYLSGHDNTTTYELKESDIGDGIYCEITAVNTVGTATLVSNTVSPINPKPVENITPPSITGPLLAGEELTCTPGTWSPATGVDFTYNWYSEGVLIAGDTQTYRTADENIGKSVECHVQGTRYTSNATAKSIPFGAIKANVIEVELNPVITGAIEVGSTIVCDPQPSVNDLGTHAIHLEWLIDNIVKGQGSQYIITSDDANKEIKCRATIDSLSVIVSSAPVIATVLPAEPPVPTPLAPPAPKKSFCDIIGTKYNDKIIGTNKGEVICGLGGDDIIYGRGGKDIIYSGPGDDIIYAGSGNDIIHAGPGNDTVLAGSGNDRVNGGPGNDRIFGQDGNDIIDGGPGHDVLSGGDGNDKIYGRQGHDRIYGGSGNDIIYAATGNDFVNGGPGNDRIWGGAGSDRLIGGGGNDTINGGAGSDIIFGQSGNDRILAGPGKDSVYGGRGHDWMDGGADKDILHGNQDNDKILGGTGDDVIYGGPGNDMIMGDRGGKKPFLNLDRPKSWQVTDAKHIGYLRAPRELYRDGGNDIIFGGSGNDILQGEYGDDYIQGNKGDDIIYEGPGGGRLYGDSGNDIFYRSPGCDQWFGGTGHDKEIIVKPLAGIGCYGVYGGA